MSLELSERSRRLLSQSLPLLEAHEQEIVERLDAALARAGSDRDPAPSGNDAKTLFAALVGQVRHRLGTANLVDRPQALPRIATLPAARPTHSQFADALVPVLKDVLGPDVPHGAPAAWNEAFWDLARAEIVQPNRKAA